MTGHNYQIQSSSGKPVDKKM